MPADQTCRAATQSTCCRYHRCDGDDTKDAAEGAQIRIRLAESEQLSKSDPVVEAKIVDRRVFLFDELKRNSPDIAGIRAGPTQTDRLIEPDAVIA